MPSYPSTINPGFCALNPYIILKKSPTAGGEIPVKIRIQRKGAARVNVTKRNQSPLRILGDVRKIREGITCYRFSTDLQGGGLNHFNGNIKTK